MFSFSKDPERPSVLLIDDDLVSREVTATVLTMKGYSVHTAEDGAKALELLKGECHPGVILVDAQMPGLSGKELLDQLRKVSRARIFTVSGSRPAEDAIASADGFLLKPFRTEELEKLLNEPVAQPAGVVRTAEGMQGNQLPVVNPETLRVFREMMPEKGVRQIYSALSADLQRRARALEAAIHDGDDAEIRRIGHAIKGGCAVAGAERAARLGEQIEMGALENSGNQSDNWNRFLKELDIAARELQRMLEAEFPSLQ